MVLLAEVVHLEHVRVPLLEKSRKERLKQKA